MHKKSTCEQRVEIMTFVIVYHFSGPTGGLLELLQYVYYLTINFLEQIRALQTYNFIQVEILQVLFTKLE